MTAGSIKDRIALEDLLVEYYHAVDKLKADEVVAAFSDDAFLDLSGFGLPVKRGMQSIMAYYEHMPANVSHTIHYVSNFGIETFDGDTATLRAYIQAFGRMKDGNEVHGHSRCWMKGVRQNDGEWKVSELTFLPSMPLPGPLDEILGSGLITE